jgi:hypothetical protein
LIVTEMTKLTDDPGPAGFADEPLLSRQDALSRARSLSQLMDSARTSLRAEQSVTLQRISGHLGVDAREATVVSHHWPSWDHVSVHRGVAAHLAANSPHA